MRIIAGQWRGRRLVAPAGEVTRPTADRVREALFSMLVSRLGSLDGLVVLDLFAGSGALGLEALSRGAASAIFVEQDARALRALDANVAALGAGPNTRVVRGSVMALGPAAAACDLAFADPPYGTGAGVVAAERLERLGWFAPAALLAMETGRREPAHPQGFAVLVERDIGKARLTLCTPAGQVFA